MALDYNLKYIAPPVASEFIRSRTPHKIISGPVGCVAGNTLIITERGLVRIDELDRPTRVLSWNAKTCQFQLSLCGGSFEKGADFLRKVTTPNGIFVAAPHHRVLLATGEYAAVSALAVGDELARYKWTEDGGREKTTAAVLGVEKEAAQEAYWDMQVADTNNYVTADGAIHHNSGKTTACIMHILLNSMQQEPDNDGIRRTRHLVIRPTVPMLKTTTIKSFLDWIPDGVFGRWLSSDKTYHMKFDDVEAEVLFMSLEDSNDIRKLLSLETTTAYFNELKEVNPDVVEGLIGTKRIGRYPSRKQGPGATYPCIIADTNMPAWDTWHQQVMDGQIGDWETFRQPSGLSPEAENIENLPNGYYSTEGLSEEYVKTMIKAEYGTSREGLPVFGATFIPSFHISTTPARHIISPSYPLIIGLDAGLTPAAVIGQNSVNGRFNILAECYTEPTESMGMERFLDTKLLPLLRGRFAGCDVLVVVDPAAKIRAQDSENTVYEMIKKKRLRVQIGSTNKTELRISSAETMFSRQVEGKAGMMINAECKGLTDALKHGYKYAAKRDGDIAEKPLKNHPDSDICFAAGTRVATPDGDRNIEDLRVGDLVLTPEGPRPVATAGCSSPRAKVWEWVFSDGSSFVATPAHPVYVEAEKGFVPLDSLTYADILEGIYYEGDAKWGNGNRNKRETASTVARVFSHLRGAWRKVRESFAPPNAVVMAAEFPQDSLSTASGSPKAGKTTIFGTSMGRSRYPSTNTCGRNTTGQSPLGSMYTTKTETPPTTTSPTCASWGSLSTEECTCSNGSITARWMYPQPCPPLEKQLSCGTGPRKGESGIGSTGRRVGKGEYPTNAPALGAGKRTLASEERGPETSVPLTAPLPNAKLAELTTSSDRVVFAAPSLAATSMLRKKRAVTLARTSKGLEPCAVYALRVEGCPMYYASGILVKNCDAFMYLTGYVAGEETQRSNERREVVPAPHRWAC